MSDEDRELPEVDGGRLNESEPLPACPIDAEERLDTERVLGSFAPRTPRLKRERLLALVKNVRQPVAKAAPAASPVSAVRLSTPWYWPAATAVMTATSLALATLLAVRTSAEPAVRVEYRDRIVYQPVSAPAQPTAIAEAPPVVQSTPKLETSVQSLPVDDYLQSRSLALAQGVEAMEFRQPRGQGEASTSPATRNELLRQLAPAKSLRTSMTTKGWIWPSW